MSDERPDMRTIDVAGPASDTPSSTEPLIGSFTAVPAQVSPGGSTILNPVFANGTGMIDNGIGTVVSGQSYATGPLSSGTVFVLEVTGANGKQATLAVSVTVAGTAPATGIQPANPSVGSASSISFTVPSAAAAGDTVVWSASAGVMNAASGTWTAPAVTTTTQVTITATHTKTNAVETTVVTVQPSATIAIGAISPDAATVIAGTTTVFAATVTGSTNTAVTWSASAGTMVASTGVWTAPSVSVDTTVTITAVASADPNQLTSTVVTVKPSTDPIAALALTASRTSAYVNDMVELTATVKTTTGAPAPDGTAVAFTASLGTLKPTSPVLTVKGQAVVTLVAPAEGTSSVTASVAGVTSTAVAITYTSAPVGYVTGEQRIAILLVSFPSVPLLSQATAELYRTAFFGAKPSVDSFLREVSYGTVWANGQVFGPFVLDADYFDQPQSARDAALRAAAKTVDLSKYNRLVLVVPQASTGLESGGLGSIGSETIKLYPTGTMTASTTWLGDASAGNVEDLLHAACHELGHNFGLQHARAADFGDEALGPPGLLPAPWDEGRKYGDSFSNMARGLGHWAAPQKVALGWLRTGTGVQEVTSDGTFVLHPYELADNTLKALRIRRGTGNDAWLWLEYRQPTPGSVDEKLPASAAGGALLHYEDAGWKDKPLYTNLVRMNPDDTRGILFGNAPLTAGKSFVDPYSNLTVTLDKDTSKGLSVIVAYAPAPPNPTALTPATSLVVAAGGSIDIAVAAAADYPWTATPSASWLTITAGASGKGPGKVTAKVAASTQTAKRWGEIRIGELDALVVQDGLPGNVAVSPPSVSVPATGAAGEIEVAANADDYSWTYTVNDPWIQSVFSSGRSLVGSQTLRYIVAENTSTTARTGTIAVGGTTFTINQAAGSPQISQLVWTQLTLADAPMSRMGLSMAGPMANGESILFGGNADTTPFTDTWAWNGSAWTQKSPGHNPGRCGGNAVAYDAARDQIVMFGGFDETSNYSDKTWIWDGVDWQQVFPATTPPGRVKHAMAYNPVTKKVVMYGGPISDTKTWEWDGTNWTGKSSAVSPPPSEEPSMAYDAARNEIILFGGAKDLWSGAVPTLYSDTWAWNGSEWQKKKTTKSPSGRSGASMAYYPEIGQVVLVGGSGITGIGTTPPYDYTFAYREETWTWDGSDWTQQFPNKSPEFSWDYGMVYEASRKQFMVYLGDDLHCADRGPRGYVLAPGAGAVLLDAYRAELPSTGGSGTIAVTAQVAWAATSDAWITLGGASAGAANGKLTFEVGANPGAEARTGKIKVNDKVFVVSQAKGP